jgi:hypothetical protein
MAEAVGALLHLILSSSGLAGAATAAATPGAVTLFATVALATAWAIVLLHGIAGPPSASTALTRPSAAIDVSAMLPQSDPDASGHPRSRAPGHAASAA